jgi:hypothetical protein
MSRRRKPAKRRFPFVEKATPNPWYCRTCDRWIRRGTDCYAPCIGERMHLDCAASQITRSA